jgi:hypothetical protein
MAVGAGHVVLMAEAHHICSSSSSFDVAAQHCMSFHVRLMVEAHHVCSSRSSACNIKEVCAEHTDV